MTYIPGIAPGALTSAGAAQAGDIIVVTRGGVELASSPALQAAYARLTPAGSRSLALTGSNTVQLTQADNDKIILLTGTTGTLGTDGSLVDGFKCNVINSGSGAATYSGITGLLSSTALATGASCTVMMVGATIYATAASGTATIASSYPSITGTRVATYDANSGVTSSGGTITAVADNSGASAASLAATAGVTVGTAVNGNNGILFTGTTIASNSGLTNIGGAAFTNNLRGDFTAVFAFKTGASLPSSGANFFEIGPSTYDASNRHVLYMNASNQITLFRVAGGTNINPTLSTTALTANTLYKFIYRFSAATANGSNFKLNGTDTTATASASASISATFASIGIGQNPFSAAGNGGANLVDLLFVDFISSAISDADATTVASYLTTRFG